MVGSAVGAAAMFGVGGGGVLAAGWGFFALNVYLLARLLWTEQHAFAVTDSDIGTKTQTGKWTTVTWGEIGSAMETSTGRRSRVTVRAVDGRPLIAFNSDLSRYGELKELVLTKVQRQGRPAG